MRKRTVIGTATRALALLAAGAVVLTAGGPVGAAPRAAQQAQQEQQTQQEQQEQGPTDTCDVYKSVPPSTEDGPAVKAIKARRSLVIGVDQNSYRWGARNPNTGQIEGFDIDLARAIGAAVMGDPDKVVLKPVATADRIDAVKKGRVDLIVRTMTINCKRMEDVAFSKPYFNTTQRVLVPKASPAKSVDDAIKDRTVCAADGSTAQAVVTGKKTAAKVVTVENQLDCLVLMQLGKVDATMTDTGLAAGQAAQDQTVRMVDGEAQPEVMGVAMLKESPDLTARVNQVLADYYARGDWARSYDHWLKPYMGGEADHYWPGTH
ncbi:polar amino acid transport system substrate-binding protein [Streptomyces sp. 1114.5]|uniref:glutamate ABC transporter substrate-binding protein n=1 Tax=Streptomyces sp. 1114.5 TaxID=1938830 RepID=UPI000EADAEC1|nr:glutamate ABC transporter substrate-binding protein [Streptomyces sp. 1114.5]RKT10946.1 polar amino acid transport system substrate-binding protein [Streptomyces sp. 1114.5]